MGLEESYKRVAGLLKLIANGGAIKYKPYTEETAKDGASLYDIMAAIELLEKQGKEERGI